MQNLLKRKLCRGDPAPLFGCRTSRGKWFDLYARVRGGPVVLLMPGGANGELFDRVEACRDTIAETDAEVYVVLEKGNRRLQKKAEAAPWSQEVLVDGEDEIVRGYVELTGTPLPAIFVLDPNLRFFSIHAPEGWADPSGVARAIRDAAHDPGVRRLANVAPALFIPRVFGPEFCAHLIDQWRDGPKVEGKVDTGISRGHKKQVDRGFKRRFDYPIESPDLETEIVSRAFPRIGDPVHKVYHLERWRFEQFRIGCYRAEDAGFFSAHRDNANALGQHRLYALTVNLNDDYDGGELRFPEYGRELYRPPAGGAIVFSCSLLHEVVPVTRGERFVLLSFLCRVGASA